MFPIIEATEYAIARRNLVYGIGVNNADYLVSPKVNGKQIFCPIYGIWRGMIARCYDDKKRHKWPTYAGCTVCNEWLTFSNFRAWVIDQDYEGKQLDKDLIKIGNKVYSPETCCFVSKRINCLLIDSAASRGDFPQGVALHKQSGKYRARCSEVKGESVSLGLFETPNKAYQAYLRKKAQVIRSAVEEYATELHPDVINTLNTKANQNINLAYYL